MRFAVSVTAHGFHVHTVPLIVWLLGLVIQMPPQWDGRGDSDFARAMRVRQGIVLRDVSQEGLAVDARHIAGGLAGAALSLPAGACDRGKAHRTERPS